MVTRCYISPGQNNTGEFYQDTLWYKICLMLIKVGNLFTLDICPKCNKLSENGVSLAFYILCKPDMEIIISLRRKCPYIL